MAFQAPNYTQTPNDFFDTVARTLKEGELRVLLVIMRQTFGWRKEWDKISLSQLMSKTGMAKSAVWSSVKSLLKKGIVKKRKSGQSGGEECWYALVVGGEQQPLEKATRKDSNNSYRFSKRTPPSILKEPPPSSFREPTKETTTKEINIKENSVNRESTPPTLPESKPIPKTLPLSKSLEGKKQFTKYQLSQEEKELVDQMLAFETPIGNTLDTAFLTVMFKHHGYERVKKAWDFTITKEVTTSLGGLLRKAIENQWELPNDEFKENKRTCEEFARTYPSRVNITQSYLTCPEMGLDISFSRPTGDVSEQLTKICKVLNLRGLSPPSDEAYVMGDF